jgi:hypothetical protein
MQMGHNLSVSDVNQSRSSNLLDNSFMKVNGKIEEYKQSIKEKIRMMKNNLANNNLKAKANKISNNIQDEVVNQNNEFIPNNLFQKEISSNSTSQFAKSYLTQYTVPSNSQPESQEFIILNSFRNRLKAEDLGNNYPTYRQQNINMDLNVLFNLFRKRSSQKINNLRMFFTMKMLKHNFYTTNFLQSNQSKISWTYWNIKLQRTLRQTTKLIS